MDMDVERAPDGFPIRPLVTTTVKTRVTLHYVGSELDSINSDNGTDPTPTLTDPGYVHLIGSWTTLDWQISYQWKPTEVTPETPKPGYDKEGKKVVGEKAIAPVPEGSHWGVRDLIANTTLTLASTTSLILGPLFC